MSIQGRGEENMNKTRLPVILKELRKSHKFTQQQLADRINISQRAYSHYEKGQCEPDVSTLIKLAEIYDISLDILTGRYIKANSPINQIAIGQSINQSIN